MAMNKVIASRDGGKTVPLSEAEEEEMLAAWKKAEKEMKEEENRSDKEKKDFESAMDKISVLLSKSEKAAFAKKLGV